MSFSERMQIAASRLLSTYGQQVSVNRKTYGIYDPELGEAPVIDNTTYTGYGNPSEYNFLELLNTNILETDIKLFFYSSTRPKVGDLLTWEGVTRRIERVDIDSAQGNDCLYTLQLRIV